MKHQLYLIHVNFFTVKLIIRFLKLMSHLLQVFFVRQNAKLFSKQVT